MTTTINFDRVTVAEAVCAAAAAAGVISRPVIVATFKDSSYDELVGRHRMVLGSAVTAEDRPPHAGLILDLRNKKADSMSAFLSINFLKSTS